jgi:hypothetical protein
LPYYKSNPYSKPSSSLLILPTFYEEDYYSWLNLTLQQVKEKSTENLDWQHLPEEIEALGSK